MVQDENVEDCLCATKRNVSQVLHQLMCSVFMDHLGWGYATCLSPAVRDQVAPAVGGALGAKGTWSRSEFLGGKD